MDFDDTKEEAEFRTLAKAFLQENAIKKTDPKQVWHPKDPGTGLSEAKEWQAKKYQAGWACLNWPKKYGGREASPIERVIWDQEEKNYLVPRGYFDIGLGMCGPTMMRWATEPQKEEFLPLMAQGEHVWCQLFSEPCAGSDLAGLRTRSEKDGDDWIINGQKIWTSGAHYSDFGILVTRSDADVAKHKGLTFFFLDMKSPGIDIVPIKQISGQSNFNEVYFNDVRIPDSQRLGDVGGGWAVSITTLMNERLSIGGGSGVDFDEIFELAKNTQFEEGAAIEDSSVREKLADWYCESSGLKYTRYRTLSALSRGETPGPEASISKLVAASKLQRIASFGIDLQEMGGILKDSNLAADGGLFQNGYLSSPAMRIAGGTDEILRNIIAERVLNLPQEARADKGIAFKDIPTSVKG